MRRIILSFLCAAAILPHAFATQAIAQDDMAAVEIKAEQIAPGVAVLFGAGGNIGVSYGEDGTVLIDDQFAPLTEKIQKSISGLGASPVKFLINTHWHGDHSGGNENFGKAGAIIMAHDNVRVRMANEQKRGDETVPASPKAALPVVTYDGGIKLHLNGEEVRVIALDPAHTDGDSIVYWTKSNVIHMGDTYFNKVTFPYIDLESGGDVRGIVKAADVALALANDETKIIPGHGAISTKAELLEYRTFIAHVIGKVEFSMKQGESLGTMKRSKYEGAVLIKQDGFITEDAFVEAVYKSLGGK
jgi:cyclase